MKKIILELEGDTYEVLIKSIEEENQTTITEHKNETETTIDTAENISSKKSRKTNTVKKPLNKGDFKEVKAPMAGSITSIDISSGDEVKEGSILILMEAMKMKVEVSAPSDGIIKEVIANVGEEFESGDCLALMEELNKNG